MAESIQRPTVPTSGGAVQGQELANGVLRFLGIPYAAPPFGPNRMRPPQPAEPWDGIRDCSSFGPTVPKEDYPPAFAHLMPEVQIPGDDCLNVNIWTPDLENSHPVLVWIHGGSFTYGSNSIAEFDGAAFARDGVVLVSINYRLGAEGFLFLGDELANVGLQDQIAALAWVRDNIAAFGGDPDRVTVAGQSAGAMSVSTLLAMPAAQGLFTQAITQSGATAHTLNTDTAVSVGHFLAEALNVEPTRDAIAAVDIDKLVRAVADLVTEVQSGGDPAKWGALALSLLPFAPVIDGETLPRHPLDAIAAGSSSSVPVLTGTTRDEARLFFVAPQTIGFIDDDALVAGAAAYGADADAVQVYRRVRPDGTPGDVLAAIVTDWFYAIPALRVAETRIRAGAAPTWIYRFDYPDPADSAGFGAAHTADIPFVFDTLHVPSVRHRLGQHPSQAVADTAHRIWVDFVTSGDPGWPAYDLGQRHVGLIGETVADVPDPARDERLVWEGIR
ncbi:carboxylesterase/lipase family protein [Gordonia rhizosphera]|uniref:Carboxylic ester hydrolase n=1 Tax=Gordonia rhizosphera NBRC 16068 TaxID=1108045 RepID=K6X4Y1_9ACTN|nr:carboxylesterase family protein [Gordonia rhizosphera]GAB93819.1 putative carboxylesterase [Gordonia rhizosphera NBRC 16068]